MKLLIWQKSMKLVRTIYEVTKKFPRSETYGLISQMRSAAVSVPSNIAEGSQRKTNKDFARFLSIARGSLAELETQCILAADIGYMREELQDVLSTISEIARMMNSFSQRLTTNH
ncbi:MAG: four helix bundle protein [Candidatus Peribacteraceae bacterium]